MPVKIFFCYAHEDETLLSKLKTHLKPLQRQGLIDVWHDRDISAGSEWAREISKQLDEAQIILLLISPDFMNSDYCYGVEMERAMVHHRAGTARVIPILIRPVDWQNAPFAALQCLPSNSRPVTSWSNRDKAWVDIATRIRTSVEEILGIVPHKSSPPQSPRNRREKSMLLRRVRAFWIEGVLEQSLHKAALIALGLQEQPDALANPWHLTVQESNRLPRDLPTNTHIAQVYDQASGELLILGEPGAGKTTLLLELARNLLTRAEQDETFPLPVVFHLSSWAEKRPPLAKWLVEELNRKYQVRRSLGQLWVTQQDILPLLDGLDEVPEEARSACILAINAYHAQYQHTSLVVCSRTTEFFDQEQRLTLLYAVTIQPLTAQQIDTYLTSASGKLEAVRVALRNDAILQQLIITPLFLSVLTLAYQGSPLDTLQDIDTGETFQPRLFAIYTERMLKRRGTHPRFSEKQTIHWLSWLARQMDQHKQSPFYIERMQPEWLPGGLLLWIHRMIVGLTVGLPFLALFVATGLSLSLHKPPDNFQDSWFFTTIFTGIGLFVGSIAGLSCGLQREIKPAERVQWSWERARRGFSWGVTGWGLIIILLAIFRVLPVLLPLLIIAGLFGIFVNRLIGKPHRGTQPTTRVKCKWPVKKAWNGCVFYSVIGLWLLSGILALVLHSSGLFLSLSTALTIIPLPIALIFGISGNVVEKNTFVKPNEGIRVSALNSILYGVSSVLILWLIIIILNVSAGVLSEAPSIDVRMRLADKLSLVLSSFFPSIMLPGLFFGLIIWLLTGGLACIQHIVLRLLLRGTNSIPKKYPHFLDYAADHILLRKVGGGYIFIHRLLLEYFASVEIPFPEKVSTPSTLPTAISSTPQVDIPYREESVPAPALGRRNTGSNRKSLITSLFVLVILLASSAGLFFSGIQHFAQNASHATATAKARVTAAAAATVAAQIAANATAAAIANASPVAYPPKNTSPVLDDPLQDNSKGNSWTTDSGCIFNESLDLYTYFTHYCIAHNMVFTNFIFEIQMTIVQGDEGGIAFRIDLKSGPDRYYVFTINRKGLYSIRSHFQSYGAGEVLAQGFSQAIHQGLDQTNLLAAVVHDNIIELFVNHQRVAVVGSNTSTRGLIGVVANGSYNNRTEVIFQNAKVWQL